MRICEKIEMLPVIHGAEMFAREVRRACSERKYDCVAVDIPPVFQDDLAEAVDELPLISALIVHGHDFNYGFHDGGAFSVGVDDDDNGINNNIDGVDYTGINHDPDKSDLSVDDVDDGYDDVYDNGLPVCYYIPVDPCDAMIEGVRQARQRRIPFQCVGPRTLCPPTQMVSMPDEYSIRKIGFDAYTLLCRKALGEKLCVDAESVADNLRGLRKRYDNILAIVHISRFDAVMKKLNNGLSLRNDNDDATDPYVVTKRYINPDHLYFALSELPFVAAKSQIERQNPFATPMDPTDAVKDLFIDTRENYYDNREQTLHLSPVRIQAALTYLRNLTVMSGRLVPTLFDIVEAAKGVGGNAYALRVLKNAKYYPFLPMVNDDAVVNVGIDRISLKEGTYPDAEREVYSAANLFRDTELFWRRLDIKPDPTMMQKKRYRYSWNPHGVCSHVPEDARIEGFNEHVRGKAAKILTESMARSEKFTSSVKDGIDIRETLRNWHTGSVYVKELPPAKNKVDTVVIIFDDDHDDLYPNRTTWYAEHEDESTLSFYSTNPFDDLIGPGVARSVYGGLALLFPPRNVPNIFRCAEAAGVNGCAAQMTAGSMMFAKEKNVAFLAAKAPSLRMRTLAARFKKHLVWIPLSTFSTETLSRMRRFHVLNGKRVRAWASRFIGDEL
jgi:hypothetical protein